MALANDLVEDIHLHVLRQRGTIKWGKYPADVLPAWVADMDFVPPRPLEQAVRKLVQTSDFGYPQRDGGPASRSVAKAFAAFMQRRHGWDADPDGVMLAADLIQAQTALVMAFSEQGDGVLLHSPAYSPMWEVIRTTGRRAMPVGLASDADAYRYDAESLRAAVAEGGARILLFCNPHNPTGYVFTRDDLMDIAAVVEEHDLIVISDEIHADLVYDGRRHVPIASLSPSMARRTITLNAATKTFGIAGLRCGVMHFGSDELRQRFQSRIPGRLLGSINNFAIDATVAAWTMCDEWLGHLVGRLQANRDRLGDAVARRFPGASMVLPQATYLAWIDFSGCGLDQPAQSFFLDKARVALNGGSEFAPGLDHFARLNFATSTVILDEIVERMAKAIGLQA